MERVLTRVEGEGEVVIVEENNYVSAVTYRITEAPRFFEYIVRGRDMQTVIDIVSRVCGLCGVSYSFVAARAFEQCLEVDVDEDIELFREVLHLVERVKSHTTHIFFLNLPDLVLTRSAIEFTQRNPQIAKIATNLILWSRKAMELLGGRFHNVVNIRVGGVYRIPSNSDIEKLRKSVNEVIDMFKIFADFVLSLKTIPEEVQKLNFVSLYTPNLYPHISGKVKLNNNIYNIAEFYDKVVEVTQKPYSNALHYRLRNGESYVVGPISRFNNFYNTLSQETKEFLELYGWKTPLRNIYQTIVARIAEIFEALLTIKKFSENYRYAEPVEKKVDIHQEELVCEAAIEAPRGILYHKYVVNSRGRITYSNIITPTAQNLAAIEDIATTLLKGRKIDENTLEVARKIPISFDPCISCSVHNLKIKIIKKS